MFGHLLGPKSLDSFKRLLACKQAHLPMTFSGIKLIPIATITPTSYLRSWGLVILIIAARFMVDQRPFLHKALT
jgi:hypothetical protein